MELLIDVHVIFRQDLDDPEITVDDDDSDEDLDLEDITMEDE